MDRREGDILMDNATETQIEQIVDRLRFALLNKFPQQISQAYFGDIINYLPSAFVGDNKRLSAVVAIAPDFDHRIEGERVAAHESRLVNINIHVLVNITQDFEATPQEAFGERRLTRLVDQIRRYLTLQANEDLEGLVAYTEVGDIDWTWAIKPDQALRIAIISYLVRIRVRRDGL